MKIKRSILFLILTIFFYSCSSTKTTDVNDGRSMAKAIKVNSVDNEYELMRSLCGGCKLKSQSIAKSPDQTKHYDLLTFKKPSGEEVQYFFDITSFYRGSLNKYD